MRSVFVRQHQLGLHRTISPGTSTVMTSEKNDPSESVAGESAATPPLADTRAMPRDRRAAEYGTTDFSQFLAGQPPRSHLQPVGSVPAAFGRYQVVRVLGTGGFGAVYLGHDTQLERPVAIKVLLAETQLRLAGSEFTLNEAKRLAQLRHPGIVAVHDIGVQDGQLYVVSDFLEGPDLGKWLLENRPAWPEAARIAAAVADALAHAHSRLIVHRDVKPANIIVTADRIPVLVDFGLALDLEQARFSRVLAESF